MAEDQEPAAGAEAQRDRALVAPPGWVPAFEGQRPPFPPGHTLSLRHGFHSRRMQDPIARELVDEVLANQDLRYLHDPRWLPALWAWGRAEAQVVLLTEYIVRLGESTGDGVGDLGEDKTNRAYLLLHRAEARATTQRTRLGLDPLSAARLGRDKTAAALDTAQLMKQLADEERRREREEVGGDAGDD